MENLFTRSLALLAAFTMCTSCVASPRKDIKHILESQKETGYGKVMKDSIASIILDAKNVTCKLQSKNPSDSLRQDTVCHIPAKMQTIVQYLFFDEHNFQSDDSVYGKFETWVCFKFEAKKKQTVYLEMDFGLKKWRLLNGDKKQICSQDMKENNTQFLRLARLMFPKDKTLNLLNDNLNIKK